MRSWSLRVGRPSLLTFGISDDLALSVGLPCGGEIDVWVDEPAPELLEQLGQIVREEGRAVVLTDLEDAFDVHEALAALPENCREILDSFFAKDESYRTIGDNLGLPAGTIASRISRCLDKLRTVFEGRNGPTLPSSEQVT